MKQKELPQKNHNSPPKTYKQQQQKSQKANPKPKNLQDFLQSQFYFLKFTKLHNFLALLDLEP